MSRLQLLGALPRWRHRKVIAGAHAFVDRRFDEPITHVIEGHVKPPAPCFRSCFQLIAPGAEYLHYWLVTTDSRMILVRLSSMGSPTNIEWQEPLHGVTVAGYKEGLLWIVMELRKRDESAVFSFRCSRHYRPDAREVTKRLDPGLSRR